MRYANFGSFGYFREHYLIIWGISKQFWVFLDTCDYLWVVVSTSGYFWVLLGISGQSWVFWDSYGSSWQAALLFKSPVCWALAILSFLICSHQIVIIFHYLVLILPLVGSYSSTSIQVSCVFSSGHIEPQQTGIGQKWVRGRSDNW